ncbi:MAG: hypothetical protein HY581_06465 [Nitrospirae bacterium]|nr:hypothetical protein [Nitrospirota bacterium]
MKRWALKVVVLAGALWLLSGGAAWALEFVAERTTQIDGQSRKASIYYRDEMWRVEHNDGGTVNVTIVRKDMGLTWLLIARIKQFKTVVYDQEQAPVVSERLDGEIAREEIGTEVLDGHPTTVYQVTVEAPSGNTEVYYQWLATDIRFPLRLARKNGDWITEYSNVKLTRVSDFMFRLPRNYQPLAEAD